MRRGGECRVWEAHGDTSEGWWTENVWCAVGIWWQRVTGVVVWCTMTTVWRDEGCSGGNVWIVWCWWREWSGGETVRGVELCRWCMSDDVIGDCDLSDEVWWRWGVRGQGRMMVACSSGEAGGGNDLRVAAVCGKAVWRQQLGDDPWRMRQSQRTRWTIYHVLFCSI